MGVTNTVRNTIVEAKMIIILYTSVGNPLLVTISIHLFSTDAPPDGAVATERSPECLPA